MNRNTNDHENTSDTEGHIAKAGRIEDADADRFTFTLPTAER